MCNSLSLIELLDSKIYRYEDMINFSSDEFEVYKRHLDYFEKTNSSAAFNNKDKADALENLVTYLIEKTNIFEVYKNVPTTSNEIDLFVRLNQRGKILLSQGLIDELYLNFICECKNYNQKIDVTWIGKFIMLTKLGNFNFGIMFSYHGLTGKNTWDNAFGLTRKFYLKENLLVIDVDHKDLIKISTDKNLLEIIKDKTTQIKHDIDLTPYLTEHPNSIHLQ